MQCGGMKGALPDREGAELSLADTCERITGHIYILVFSRPKIATLAPFSDALAIWGSLLLDMLFSSA